MSSKLSFTKKNLKKIKWLNFVMLRLFSVENETLVEAINGSPSQISIQQSTKAIYEPS